MSESDSQIRQGILVMLVLVRYVKPGLRLGQTRIEGYPEWTWPG